MTARHAKVLTVSDGVIAGTRADGSGDALVDALGQRGFDVVERRKSDIAAVSGVSAARIQEIADTGRQALSTASPRRREQAAATRELILNAAQSLFERDGYAATSMAAVAERFDGTFEIIRWTDAVAERASQTSPGRRFIEAA